MPSKNFKVKNFLAKRYQLNSLWIKNLVHKEILSIVEGTEKVTVAVKAVQATKVDQTGIVGEVVEIAEADFAVDN